MPVRFLGALLLVVGAALQLLGAEAFDAVAFVKSLRQSAEVDIATRELEKVPDRSTVHCMDFSVDGKTLCAVHSNGIIATWDVASGKIRSIKRIRGSKLRAQVGADTDMFVERYALSQDHSRVGLALRSGDVVFWDVDKETVISQLESEFKGKCSGLVLSSTGKYALLGGEQTRGVLAIDTDTGKKAFVHDAAKSDITHVAITLDDGWAIFAENDAKVHIYPLLGGKGGFFALETPVSVEHLKGTNYGALFVTNHHELQDIAPGMRQSYSMRVSVPAKVVVSANAEYFVLYDRESNLEIRSIHAPGAGWHRNFADDKALMFAIGPDGRTLAIETQEGTHLKSLSAFPEHPAARMRRKLRELLAAENFHALKLIAQQLHKEQDQPFAWSPLEAPLDILCEGLIAQRDVEPVLETWAAEDPEALLPKLLLAKTYIRTAWVFRGGDVAAKVTEEGWKGFREYIGKARAVIMPLCEKPNAPAPVRTTLLTVAMAESWPEEDWMPHADWMRTNAPKYQRGHQRAVQMLLPRWGGKPGDSARYAAALADAVGGAEGDAVYAIAWLSNYDLHGKAPNIVAEMGMDFERVKRGLLHLADESANPLYFAHRGLQVTFQQQDPAGARAFAGKLKDPKNSWEVGWWRHSHELEQALRYADTAAAR